MHIFTASVADWTFVEPITESFGPSRDLNFLILFPKDLKFKSVQPNFGGNGCDEPSISLCKLIPDGCGTL